MNKVLDLIKNSITVGQPIIQIISYEEKRVISHLKKLCEQLSRSQVLQWDINGGLVNQGQRINDRKQPEVSPCLKK